MIHQYIERKLQQKNRGVYFKKGKWILHLVSLLVIWIAFTVKLSGNKLSGNLSVPLSAGLLNMVPFVIFFYFYCLYLIPSCFKRNQYKKFWLILISLLLVFPLIDYCVKEMLLQAFPSIKGQDAKQGTAMSLFSSYKGFIGNFTGFTSMLYIMELLEEVRTSKEIHLNSNQLILTERNMVKTRMNPQFMIRSLDGITRLAETSSEEAPASVVTFSDVLRYRLYHSARKTILLEEELQYLDNLLRFQNTINGTEAACALDIEGDTTNKYLPPLSLINIAEPLLNTYDDTDEWSLLYYLLIEEDALQIAIELSTGNESVDAELETIKNDLGRLFPTDLIFTVEKNQNAYSIRTCIPIQTDSIA
jgi:two-component system LytT family sensor kinase